jgi:pimeloyl-ACP methyl ester carboxylesterase
MKFGLGRVAATVSGIVALLLTPPTARADGVTYTVEPFSLDGVGGINLSVTQNQLGGSLCPCIKVPYIADGLHNADGIAALANTQLRAGDTVLGFSLGSQVISAYLARHTPPPGVRFVLLGDTFARNEQLAAIGQGVPADIGNEVILVARQYDGWSDFPTNSGSPHYGLAMQNAVAGAATIHDYVNVRLDDPANVVTKRGNITSILIPTQHLPINNQRRNPSVGADDRLDSEQRPLIDSAYDRPGPTAQQLAASTGQQAGSR